jgi:hypothetical protein
VERRPRRIEGLEVTRVDDGYIVYRPERDRLHYLNHTAVLVLELCTGQHTPAAIAELVRSAYALAKPPAAEVEGLLAQLEDEGLITTSGGDGWHRTP